jgi:hypothetical protein
MAFQLWELMIRLEVGKSMEELSCSECFALVEFLVEGAALGIDRSRLESIARDHLSQCSGCKEALLEQLQRLEMMQ